MVLSIVPQAAFAADINGTGPAAALVAGVNGTEPTAAADAENETAVRSIAKDPGAKTVLAFTSDVHNVWIPGSTTYRTFTARSMFSPSAEIWEIQMMKHISGITHRSV